MLKTTIFYGYKLQVLWIELGPPPNTYVKILMPVLTVFGDRAFKEAIRTK